MVFMPIEAYSKFLHVVLLFFTYRVYLYLEEEFPALDVIWVVWAVVPL